MRKNSYQPFSHQPQDGLFAKEGRKIKVIVAMSGGVDSSVTAALLKKRGFEVEGIYMRLAGSKQLTDNNEKYAKKVAKKIDIKFKILDLRREFKKSVIDCFLNEFKAGRTPNPCVVCNQKIKFGFLLDYALSMGADFVATGHYARVTYPVIASEAKRSRGVPAGLLRRSTPRNDEKFHLLTAKDATKDQSYFLYNLTQEKLARILFPLGEYKKSEIYKIAEKLNLPHKKGESMDICFVGKRSHKDFLKERLGVKQGKIIDENRKILGKHNGIWFYTIGQRADIGGPGPFYVVRIDARNNAVIVSNKFRGEELYKKNLIAENVNWIGGSEPKMPMKCWARIRYGHTAVECVIARREAPWQSRNITKGLLRSARNDKNSYIIRFKNLQRAITHGQSIVFYRGKEVLGGGVIE